MNRIRAILLITAALFSINPVVSQTRVIEFDNPKMKVFLPPAEMGNGKAVVACPGGGYSHIAQNHEGYNWAPFFNNLGFAYAVLEYRLPDGDKTIPLNDVRRTFEILCDSAAVWKINPEKIGIMGSSAGGHLASAIATHPEGKCVPDFQILFYPVISLDESITHKGTRKGFLGENPSDAEIAEWSSYNKVTPVTSPVFLALCSDDKVVKPRNSILYYNALVENGVPAAMFIYPHGGHGWGYRTSFRQHNQMLQELTDWLSNLDSLKSDTK